MPVRAEEAAEIVDEEAGCAVGIRDQPEPQSPQCQTARRGKDLTMASRKWLYSYRILTARLRDGADAPLNVGSAAQPRLLSANAEAEAKPAKPARLLTAGRKT